MCPYILFFGRPLESIWKACGGRGKCDTKSEKCILREFSGEKWAKKIGKAGGNDGKWKVESTLKKVL